MQLYKSRYIEREPFDIEMQNDNLANCLPIEETISNTLPSIINV